MINLKKFYSDELLQLALILSLLRVDPDSYLGLDIQTVGIGSLDLNNGSGWHTDSHTIVHRPAFVHPKNLDSILLNYERDLFEDLNALGRYNRINAAHNDIHAYLLNIDDKAGPSAAVNNATDNARNTTSPDPPQPSQTSVDNLLPAELTQEDMDLIEVLWKQDVDLGFTLVDPTKNSATTSKKESEDDLEKLKALEAINHADEKEPKIKEEEPTKEEDPWAGIPYTVDLETGEYILSTATTSSPESEATTAEAAVPSSSSSSTSQPDEEQENQEPRALLGEASLGLVGLSDEDSLGLHDSLGLEDDFASDLLANDCLLDDCAEGFLSNDSLGLPDGFNLEEALQLVGLDEVELEKPEVKEKSKLASSDGERSDSRASTSDNDEDNLKGAEEEASADMNVIHPQYHHPHARSFQRGMPLVRPMEHHQRWPDMFGSEPFAHPGAVNPLHQSHLNYTVHHTHHHHHHQPYGDVTAPPPRHALMSNATIPPPVGDLNSTGTYHNTGNLGSAVATSMNLTNNGEALSADGVTPFKPEPSDMMSSYYPQPSNDTVNQTDIPFFLDDPIMPWADDSFGVNFNNVSDGMAYGGNSTTTPTNNTSNNGPATTTMLPGVTGSQQSPNDDGRMETSSDSAVSSMGSERVPSLSDGGEWMETGSNSSHTQADTHYSMDYNGKYRMPYDCGYSLAPGAATGGGRRGSNNCQQSAAERAGLAPVAQKKHHMFGKRCFQDQQGPMTPGATAVPPSKYDYDAAQNVAAAGPPGQAYSGPIEGAAGPQPEIKYSCSVDFNRHQSARSSLEHVHHNHTYNLPPESSGALQRPVSRDKKARKHEADEHMTRDEKRARALNVPISVSDIINLPMDEFNERLSKYDLNDSQLGLIRDIRRRGKNKVAAQNCRKRKLDQINSLSDEVREMRTRKMRLKNDREYMLQEVARVKEKFGQLYRHVLHSLRDPAGRPYDPREYSLQLSAEGNVVLVPKSNQSTHYGFPMKKPDHHQQQHHHHHKE